MRADRPDLELPIEYHYNQAYREEEEVSLLPPTVQWRGPVACAIASLPGVTS